MGYEWDRVITWIKDPGLYIVFDILKGRREQFLTAANTWHTRKILSSGSHWYETAYDSIGSALNDTKTRLLIYFPRNKYRLESVEPERRNYRRELAIMEYSGQFFELGQSIGFVTVLIPLQEGENAPGWIDKVKLIETGESEPGLSMEINHKGETILVGIKCDLRMDMLRDNRRPKYTWESGRISYGSIETNSDFFITRKSGSNLFYTAVNLTGINYLGKKIFEQKKGFYGLNYDGGPDMESTGKVRYRRESIDLNKL
jgi:hypothetical protein